MNMETSNKINSTEKITMIESVPDSYQYTQNRELSWLNFNKRVLEEAMDESVPLLERLKFISIFTSNLDEFFMVRVGSIYDINQATPLLLDNKTGWTPKEQLKNIYKKIHGLIPYKYEIYQSLMNGLKSKGIEDVQVNDLTGDEFKYVHKYFKKNILPIVSPIIIGKRYPIPHFANKKLYVSSIMIDKKTKKSENTKNTIYIGVVEIPNKLPSYIVLPSGDKYIRTENIISTMVSEIFKSYKIIDVCVLSVTRNADLKFDEEKFEDSDTNYKEYMSRLIKKRETFSVLRLEIDRRINKVFMDKLMNIFNVTSNEVFLDHTPLNMKYVFKLENDLDKGKTHSLVHRPFYPVVSSELQSSKSIMKTVEQHDVCLFYPFDSIDSFLKLLNEAAYDPAVVSIKITIYRLSSTSKIAQLLCRAAENGKDVLVFMELKARFDESNNILWSDVLEEAGCKVVYGIDGYKCHAKVCLITRQVDNQMKYITQIGTGNYNEKTSLQYTDLSVITASQEIGEDAVHFFINMLTNNVKGEYTDLCVSPHGIKDMIFDNIEEQIKLGREGYICIKANSMTDLDVINELIKASVAGVTIDLIIRGICCVLPYIIGYSENIHIISIVGRYLEHARIYQFGKDKNMKLYISSADIMPRNLSRRVEVACPIHDDKVKEKILSILKIQLKDNEKACSLSSTGEYVYNRTVRGNTPALSSQDYFMNNPL